MDAGSDALEHDDADSDCEERSYDDPPGAFGLRKFQAKDERCGFKDASGRVVILARFIIAYQFMRGGIAAET